jgi:hypothetical protein
MRRLQFPLLLSLLAIHACLAQDRPMSSEAMVQNALRTGVVDGHVDKYFKRAGDAGAVTMMRVLGEKHPSDNQVDEILVFLTDAFSELRSVEVPSDREPRVTLLLLRYLDYSTQSAVLKSRIADTRSYVRSEFAKLAGGREDR